VPHGLCTMRIENPHVEVGCGIRLRPKHSGFASLRVFIAGSAAVLRAAHHPIAGVSIHIGRHCRRYCPARPASHSAVVVCIRCGSQARRFACSPNRGDGKNQCNSGVPILKRHAAGSNYWPGDRGADSKLSIVQRSGPASVRIPPTLGAPRSMMRTRTAVHMPRRRSVIVLSGRPRRPNW
jgi:hypothetical protein